MAHNSDYSHIYATPPTVGLSLYEIMRCLGANTQDLGRLCTSSLVKPMAKYKPVRRNKIGPLTDIERAGAGYGLTPASTATPTTAPYALYQQYDGGMNGWALSLPRGAASQEWFRVLDFDGYINNPTDPIRSYNPTESVQVDTTPATFPFVNFIGSTDAAGLSIELAEIAEILSDNPAAGAESLYFGVALFKTDGEPTASTLFEIATSSTPIGKNSQGVYVGCGVSFTKVNNATAKGTWLAIPFFSKQAISQQGAWEGQPVSISTKFYTVPFARLSTLKLYDHSQTYTVSPKGVKTSLAVSATITFQNRTTSPVTLNASMYYWDSRVSGTPDTRAVQGEEKMVQKTNIVLPAYDADDPDSGKYVWIPGAYGPSTAFVAAAVGYVKVDGAAAEKFTFFKEDVI